LAFDRPLSGGQRRLGIPEAVPMAEGYKVPMADLKIIVLLWLLMVSIFEYTDHIVYMII
jgi:hypothetical protein